MHCVGCGINLEPDFDDENGLACAQCSSTNNVPGDYIRLESNIETLTQADVDILDGSKSRSVRIDKGKDAEVKRLYRMYKSL